jgi:hypothetical protein
VLAAAVATMVRIAPITVVGTPHDDVQPVWMKIAAEANASMPEVIVTSCAAIFFVVYKCMAMLTQASIAAVCAIRLIVAKLDADAKGADDSVNADGRLRGRYICDPENRLQGKKTEARFSDAPTRIA